ncbi:PGF-CTERM sorting domain-containing protein [Haloprofundus halobius]|nr:PGF-CTERM sorting domain-containing protein [Haloprofundus halobius]
MISAATAVETETNAGRSTTSTPFPGFGPLPALLAALTAGLLLARRR